MSDLERLHIVFLDRDTIAPQVVVRRPDFEHTWVEYPQTTPDQLSERLADGASIVITNKVPLRASMLAQAPGIKLIAVAATGTDVVDVGYCREHGIAVCNIRGYAVDTVPEHTFALIFALRRNLLAYALAVRRGRWQQSGQFCFFDFPINCVYTASFPSAHTMMSALTYLTLGALLMRV